MRMVSVGLALMLLSTLKAQQGPGNLVINGDMEQDQDGDGMADCWQFAGDEGVAVQWGRDAGAGGACQRLTCAAFTAKSPASHAMLCQVGVVRLEQGKFYRLTFRARGERIRQGVVSVAISDTRDWTSCGLRAQFSPSHHWQSYAFDFEATRTVSDSSRLQFWYTSTGTFWLDDVVLVETQPRPRRYVEVVLDLGGKNKVPNGSFECGTAGWGSVGWFRGWGGDFNTLLGDVVDDGLEGGKCLRIALAPQTAPVHHFDYFTPAREKPRRVVAASRGWITVRPAESYVLSAWMRSEPAGLIGVLAAQFSAGGQVADKYSLCAKWQRVALPFEARSDQVYVAAGLDLEASQRDRGTVWLDRVQLEAGTTPTQWQPRAAVEVGVEWPSPGHLFDRGDVPHFTLRACNASGEPREVERTLSITDFFGDDVAAPRLRLKVPPASAIERQVTLDDARRLGFYRVALQAPQVGIISHLPERCAVIAPYSAPDSLFGMNNAYPWDHLNALCGRFGLRWFRDWSLKWQTVEPQPGQFDFAQTDPQINRVLKLGLNVLPLLPFPSSNWASSAPASVTEERDPSGPGRAAWMPKDLDAFGEYVRRTVGHYKDRLHVWEILNEPIYTFYALPASEGYKPADYIRLLKVAYRSVKAVDPRAKVIGGIAAGPLTAYTKEFIAAGGLKWVDFLNLHDYPGIRAPEAYDQDLAELRRLMAQAGYAEKPIWFTEGAYYADDDPAWEPFRSEWIVTLPSERDAALNQVKFDVIFMAYGVRKFIYHSGTCGRLNEDNTSSIFFEWEGAPRKMVATQAALSQLFGPDTVSLGRLRTPEDVWAYGFTSAGKTIIVLWNDPGAPPRAIKRVAGVGYRDVLGNPVRTPPAVLDDVPVYLVIDGERPLSQAQQIVNRAW